jgi:Arc/MetJ-type ribon-helix-helix transcriptional regulator
LGDTKKDDLSIHLDSELSSLISQAVRRIGLSRSEVVRQGLRKGLPEVARATKGPRKGRTLVDALLGLKGLEIPERRCRMKRRF